MRAASGRRTRDMLSSRVLGPGGGRGGTETLSAVAVPKSRERRASNPGCDLLRLLCRCHDSRRVIAVQHIGRTCGFGIGIGIGYGIGNGFRIGIGFGNAL